METVACGEYHISVIEFKTFHVGNASLKLLGFGSFSISATLTSLARDHFISFLRIN